MSKLFKKKVLSLLLAFTITITQNANVSEYGVEDSMIFDTADVTED